MRRAFNFLGSLAWGMLWVGVLFALLLFVLHIIRSHIGGFVGGIAATAESAITPGGGASGN